MYGEISIYMGTTLGLHNVQDLSRIPQKYHKNYRLSKTIYTPYAYLQGTDGWTHRWTDNIYSIFREHSLRVSWRNFFPVVLLCQFLVLVRNRFWFYILTYLEYNTVVSLCQFFGSGGKQFLVLRTYLVYNTVVRLCQFLGHSSQSENTF